MPLPRLELFVRECTPAGRSAREHVERFCRETLRGAVELTVTDIDRHPEAVRSSGVLLAPLLLRRLDPGERRVFGDFSDAEAIARALGLDEVPA